MLLHNGKQSTMTYNHYNELLQMPLKLLPISDFLECSYLYYLVEAVMKEGKSYVISHYHLNQYVYQVFYAVTNPV